MSAASKPWWQQATAVVSLGASGAITGFSFTPGTAQAAAHPSPAQIRLLALQQVAKPAHNSDAALRSAIVNVAQYYLRMAASHTPAAMEALIWQHDSVDGVDHGPSCAAFASLTLELGSQAIGEQSWVTGGSSYPWPLHDWADVRVDPNPASPAVISILQDAQAHGRWHPLGDGYKPQPGDWVLFNGHVEVVTDYAGGVLHTIGGDSLPNFTVNAHELSSPLSAQGVVGFVNNGMHPGSAGRQSGATGRGGRANQATGRRSGGHTPPAGSPGSADALAAVGAAAVPGTSTPAAAPAATAGATHGSGRATGSAVRAGGSGRPAGSGGSAGGSGSTARSGSSASGSSTQTGSGGSAGASATQAGSGSSGGSASQGPEPARGQWHATHPRTSHRPARPLHPHAAGARPAGGNPSGGGTAGGSDHDHSGGLATASVPGAIPGAVTLGPPAQFQKAANGGAFIPGLPTVTRHPHGHRAAPPSPGTGAPSSGGGTGTSQSGPAPAQSPQAQMTSAQRAFIAEVAPGAVAAAHRYGVPASVTIAQAIDESGWGQSVLASKDHNLFGMKGAGPAGTDTQLTQEYANGQWVVTAAPFRAYQSVAQSIDDHGRLLATSDYYRNVMADRHNPDAFASALTGVYATDPSYGQTLIGLMRQYNLYQYDHAASPAPAKPAAAKPAQSKPAPAQRTTAPADPGQASVPGLTQPAPGSRGSGTTPGRGSHPIATSPPRGTRPAPSSPPRTGRPSPGSPPGSTRPTPSSPPTSAPPPSSPPRAARPVPNSPARGGQPGPGSAPRSTRSAPSPSQPGSSFIPGLSQPPSRSTGRATRPGPGATGNGQPRRGSAGSAVAGSIVPGSTAPGSTVPGRAPASTSPQGGGPAGTGQPARPAAPAGSSRSGSTARTPSAKPVKAALVADWSPAPASAGVRTTVAASAATSTARASVGARTTAASSPAPSTARASAVSAGRGGSAGTRTTASAEPSPGDTATEWDPASWVPAWASERSQPTDSEAAGGQSDADGLDGAATVDTTAGQAGTGRRRVATGLRSRLAAVRPSRTATAAGSAPMQGRYQRPLPRAVRSAFQAMAAGPLERAEPMYRDVAGHTGLPWELLAACDWMQCEAKPRHSPVHGEKLGTTNEDGTAYWTKSAALEQCAEELVELAGTVYGIDLTSPGPLSVRDLANTFAAFRWGELLKVHRTSAMEFPYSVAGLTVQHIGMRWPTINDPKAPDKPGSRFRMHFGAVPVLLSLDYPALA